MPRPLKVLLLETSPAAIENILRELRRHDFDPHLLPASAKTEYLAALDQAPDLILANAGLPQISVREALALRDQLQLTTPCIVLLDPAEEENGVELLQLGAADYLIKDRLARLGPAILRALELEALQREQSQFEGALAFCEKRFRTAVESVPHPFYAYDASLHIRFANANCSQLFGLPTGQILGRTDRQLFPDDIADLFLPTLEKARAERKPASVDCTLPLPLGERNFQINYHPLLTESGAIKEILTLAIDRTELQRIERLKDDMLSAVSHEMRSPLTAIIGFSEFLVHTPVNRDKQVEYMEIIHKESERLKELIENILDLQRLKANFHNDNFSILIIQQLLQKVLKRFQSTEQKYTFVLDCPINQPLLEGNEAHLYRALENLLSNAIKYSEPGSTITLGAHTDETEATLWVKDQGVGIAEQFHDQVFDRFFRIKAGNRRKSGGTGLGLALVKEIIQGHQGSVWVESSPGQGSAFYLRLPLKHRLRQE